MAAKTAAKNVHLLCCAVRYADVNNLFGGMTSFDYIVIGGGVIGSYSAYILSKRNYRVLMLEQYNLPHTRGSSHGNVRQIHKFFFDRQDCEMMGEAHKMWAQLEKEFGRHSIFVETGVLYIDKNDANLHEIRESLKNTNTGYEWFKGFEISAKFPLFRLDEAYSAILDKSAGLLKANDCLQALWTLFIQHDGVIQDNEEVFKIKYIRENLVEVETKNSKYSAKAVIIAAGPWSSKVLNQLGINPPLEAVRMDVWFYKQVKDEQGLYRGMFPIFVMNDENRRIYSLPSFQYPGMAKIVYNNGAKVDPDKRTTDDRDVLNKSHTEYVSDFLRNHMPMLATTPSIMEKCIATYTPDFRFVIDRHPKWRNIVFGAGLCGHGFKFAPVIAKLLVELATGLPPSYSLERFRWNRFK